MADDTFSCRSCGHTIMIKGGDSTRWKSVQPKPNDATMWHYCPKKPCQDACKGAIRTAMVAWGYDVPEDVADVAEIEVPVGLMVGRGGDDDGSA